jgi:hypothetical protein
MTEEYKHSDHCGHAAAHKLRGKCEMSKNAFIISCSLVARNYSLKIDGLEVSVLISLISDTSTPCVLFDIKLIFARGWFSGACSGSVTSWPSIAVPPGSAHFPYN